MIVLFSGAFDKHDAAARLASDSGFYNWYRVTWRMTERLEFRSRDGLHHIVADDHRTLLELLEEDGILRFVSSDIKHYERDKIADESLRYDILLPHENRKLVFYSPVPKPLKFKTRGRHAHLVVRVEYEATSTLVRIRELVRRAGLKPLYTQPGDRSGLHPGCSLCALAKLLEGKPPEPRQAAYFFYDDQVTEWDTSATF